MRKRPPIAAKRDANEPEIFAILKSHGIAVYPMDKPMDALCGYGGQTRLVEIKNGPKATYTDGQKAFLETWKGDFTTLTSMQDALDFAREWRRAVREIQVSGVVA